MDYGCPTSRGEVGPAIRYGGRLLDKRTRVLVGGPVMYAFEDVMYAVFS